eukprot:jgi/Tetstr1/428598/TSEL_018589.t1
MLDTEFGIHLGQESTTLVIRRDGGNYLTDGDLKPPFIDGVVAVTWRGLRHARVGPRALAGLLAPCVSCGRTLLKLPWRIVVRRDWFSAGFSRCNMLAGTPALAGLQRGQLRQCPNDLRLVLALEPCLVHAS